MPFKNNKALDLEFVDGVHWVLLKPLFYSGKFWHGAIPGGFVTDFASVPRVFWNILPPAGTYGPAAVLHDYLYTIGVPKENCDKSFLEAMESLGVSRVVRYTMYYGVKFGGGPAYRKHRAEDQAIA